MEIHYYDLMAASLIQERHTVSLEECGTKLNKSVSSIKRSISCINEYLPASHQILIANNQAIFQMTYKEYLAFIQSLTLKDYYPSQKERLNIMAAYAFFNRALNMTHLYESLYISLSTKKKDSRALSNWLSGYGLATEVIPKTGIKITGDEVQYRILITRIISGYVELDRNFHLTMRKANSPLQKLISEYFLVNADPVSETVNKAIQQLQKQKVRRISYASVKFLYLYLSCAIFRLQSGHTVQDVQVPGLPVDDYCLLEDAEENLLLNHLISALDYTPLSLPPEDEFLSSAAKNLVRTVQEHIITWISDDHCIYEEIYAYLHKCIIRNMYQISFYDNKLEDTRDNYNNLYEIIKAAASPCEEHYGLCFSQLQISSLTLIFRKYINKNKLAGRNQKKLVIVTNSSIEKIGFFMEQLKLRVDVALVDVININELYMLEEKEYDYLIVFSNRIGTLLEEAGYPYIKLHFYLGEDDYRLLEENGFSTSKRKIKVSQFIQSTASMDRETLASYLLEKYSGFFME